MSSYSGIVETQSVANKQVEDEVPDPAGDDEWFTLLDEEIDEFKRAIKAVPPKSKYPHLSQEEYNQLPEVRKFKEEFLTKNKEFLQVPRVKRILISHFEPEKLKEFDREHGFDQLRKFLHQKRKSKL